MDTINYYQIAILSSQCILVSALILILFRIRSFMGLSLLYAALGLFQFMQVFLASTIYIEIAKGIFISPGSSVLFAGGLFAVLLVYIKEDTLEIRKIVYALLIANIIMSIMLYSFGWNFYKTNVYNPLNVSTKFFENNAWVLFVGTITLFFDTILIIVLFEFISKAISNLFFRIYLTMALVLSFDTICFSICAFWGADNLLSIIYSGLIAKNGSVIIYSLLFYIYLKFIDKEKYYSSQSTFKDIFYTLSYKQKFEIVEKEIEVVQKDVEKAIQLSQVKYQILTDIAPVGIFFTKADGYTVFVNHKWTTISGISQAAAIGYGWLDAVHPDDKEKTEKGWKLATINNKSSYAEYRFLHPDGTIKWVLGQAVPEYNEKGEIIGYVGTITNITDIKIYEKELKIAKEKAEESERLKMAFLQNMSHEIRTPLNAICGFSDFLVEKELSAEKKKYYVSIIQKSSNQLLTIVSDILAISSLETKQEKVKITKTNIMIIINNLFQIYKRQAIEKNIELRIESKLSNNKSVIYTDKMKIIQILTNLISNALKFTHKGFIEIGYNILEKEQPPDMLQFYVKDTGIGVEQELQDKIFERFRQADLTMSRRYGGTGLGLSISKGFVELLNGKIWLQSEKDKGSTFYFTIPYNTVNESDNNNTP